MCFIAALASLRSLPTHSIRKTTTITLEIASLIDYRSLSASDCPTWAAACQGCGSAPTENVISCVLSEPAHDVIDPPSSWYERICQWMSSKRCHVTVVGRLEFGGGFGGWRNSHLPSESKGAITQTGEHKPDLHTICKDGWRLPCIVT